MVMEKIRKQLSEGVTAQELIEQGYKRSSVYKAQRQTATSSSRRGQRAGTPPEADDEEIAELRKKREVKKLELEIAKLENQREELPSRVKKLEEKFVGDEFDRLVFEALRNRLADGPCPHCGSKGILALPARCFECGKDFNAFLGVPYEKIEAWRRQRAAEKEQDYGRIDTERHGGTAKYREIGVWPRRET